MTTHGDIALVLVVVAECEAGDGMVTAQDTELRFGVRVSIDVSEQNEQEKREAIEKSWVQHLAGVPREKGRASAEVYTRLTVPL